MKLIQIRKMGQDVFERYTLKSFCHFGSINADISSVYQAGAGVSATTAE